MEVQAITVGDVITIVAALDRIRLYTHRGGCRKHARGGGSCGRNKGVANILIESLAVFDFTAVVGVPHHDTSESLLVLVLIDLGDSVLGVKIT